MSKAVSDIVKRAISEGVLSMDDLAKCLGTTRISAYRRLRVSNWKVKELEILEREFGLRFPGRGLSVVSKRDNFSPETEEKKSKGVRISIEIDPENFNPEDLQEIMNILNRNMTKDFEGEK